MNNHTELSDDRLESPSTSSSVMPTYTLSALSSRGLANPRIHSTLSGKQQKVITEGFNIKPLPEAILEGRISKGDLLQREDDGNTNDDDLIHPNIKYADPDQPCTEYLQFPIGEKTSWHFQKKVKSLTSECSSHIPSALRREHARVTLTSLEVQEDEWRQRARKLPHGSNQS